MTGTSLPVHWRQDVNPCAHQFERHCAFYFLRTYSISINTVAGTRFEHLPVRWLVGRVTPCAPPPASTAIIDFLATHRRAERRALPCRLARCRYMIYRLALSDARFRVQ